MIGLLKRHISYSTGDYSAYYKEISKHLLRGILTADNDVLLRVQDAEGILECVDVGHLSKTVTKFQNQCLLKCLVSN
jgi:hypothetical protein